jgi:putative dehydrogenase
LPDRAPAVVAIAGLGRMGSAMAARLCLAGFTVHGYDIDVQRVAQLQARGGIAAASPAQAAAHAAVLVVMVHDETEVDAALFGSGGAVPALRPGCAIWLASTVSPAYALKLAERLAVRALLFVDGPVSGGTTGASAGELSVIAGGTSAAIECTRKVMQACAARVFHVGDAGSGSTVKMINQLLVAVHSVLTSESMLLSAAAGLDTTKVIDVVAHSAGHSVIFGKRAPLIARGNHDVQVSIATLHKDLAIALEAASGLGVDLRLARAAFDMLQQAINAGRGELSDTELLLRTGPWPARASPATVDQVRPIPP